MDEPARAVHDPDPLHMRLRVKLVQLGERLIYPGRGIGPEMYVRGRAQS